MCNTHTCHKFLKAFIVKEEFRLQPELLEVSRKGKSYFQDLVILGTLVPKDYQSTRGSFYLMYLRQRQRMSINRTRKLLTYGIQSPQNLSQQFCSVQARVLNNIHDIFCFLCAEFVPLTAESLV